MKVRNFSKKQLALSANILGNMSVAWFAGGIISPIFLKSNGYDLIFSIMIGIIATGVFSFFALLLINVES